MTRMGPNDARHVVWAIGEFPPFFHVYKKILTIVFVDYST